MKNPATCAKMPFAVVITPKLVRLVDYDGNHADVWVAECPYWLAQYLCENARGESDMMQQQMYLEDQQETTMSPPFAVYYAPGT